MTVRSRLAPWLWAAPTLLILTGYLVYPVLVTLYDSFRNADLSKFVGWDNYVWAFTDSGSLLAIRDNIFWIIFATTATVALGLTFAVLADRVGYEALIKAVIFMPMAISFVGAGVIWKFMYDWQPSIAQQIGVLNAAFTAQGVFAAAHHTALLWLLSIGFALALVTFFIALIRTRAFVPSFLALILLPLAAFAVGQIAGPLDAALALPPNALDLLSSIAQLIVLLAALTTYAWAVASDTFGKVSLVGIALAAIAAGLLRLADFQPVTWLQNEATNNWALAIVYIWIWTGFCLVVLSAALKGIPTDVIEAARVDGADEFQVFAQVLVPMIGPTILVVATTMVINILKVFDIVYVMTSGNFQTDVIANAMYYQALIFQNFGRGAALAVILLAAVIPVMLFNIRRFRSEEAAR